MLFILTCEWEHMAAEWGVRRASQANDFDTCAAEGGVLHPGQLGRPLLSQGPGWTVINGPVTCAELCQQSRGHDPSFVNEPLPFSTLVCGGVGSPSRPPSQPDKYNCAFTPRGKIGKERLKDQLGP